ncbi:MAG: OB-fold nucleic acid binding domain-containing protein, partial [Chitinophagaceae bacterium]
MYFKAISIAKDTSILSSPIEYLKGVGPQRAEMLKKELGIFTFGDLLVHFPYRHIDRTRIWKIAEIGNGAEYVQVAGRIESIEMLGAGRAKRLVALLRDDTGIMELAWFQGISWVQKKMEVGQRYVVFGKTGFFMGKPQMVHPELEPMSELSTAEKSVLEPVYPSTE